MRLSLPRFFYATSALLLALVPARTRAQAAAPAASYGPLASAPGSNTELVGRSYSVEVRSGSRFVGVLQAADADALDFDTPDLGRVHVLRPSLKELVLLSPGQARTGRDYVGNGERLFFGPTARNLHKGEGSVQDVDVFVLTANYGLSNNFSMGVIATFLPSIGSSNLFGLTPKASLPLGGNVRAGAGALVLFVGGETVGATYANATVGSADHHLTGGVGFGFSGSRGFGSTPVLMVGGATRVGRRVSLVDETYVVRASSSSSSNRFSATGVAGIAGIRLTWPRISGGLGLAYVGFRYNDAYASSSISNSIATTYPYLDVAFRFGTAK